MDNQSEPASVKHLNPHHVIFRATQAMRESLHSFRYLAINHVHRPAVVYISHVEQIKRNNTLHAVR
jgi:hypothetical protein